MSGPAAAVAPQPDAATGAAVCAALRREVERLGLSIGNEPDWSLLSFEEKIDPFSQEVSLIGTWRGSARYGTAENCMACSAWTITASRLAGLAASLPRRHSDVTDRPSIPPKVNSAAKAARNSSDKRL